MLTLLPVYRVALDQDFNPAQLEMTLRKQPNQLTDYPQLKQKQLGTRAYNQMMHHPSREYTPAQQQLILAGEAIAHGYQSSLADIVQKLLEQLDQSDAPVLNWDPDESFDLLEVELPVDLTPKNLQIDQLDTLIRNCFINTTGDHTERRLAMVWGSFSWDCRAILLMIISQLLTNGTVSLTLPTDSADATLIAQHRALQKRKKEIDQVYQKIGVDPLKTMDKINPDPIVDTKDPHWKEKYLGLKEGETFE